MVRLAFIAGNLRISVNDVLTVVVGPGSIEPSSLHERDQISRNFEIFRLCTFSCVNIWRLSWKLSLHAKTAVAMLAYCLRLIGNAFRSI